MSIFQTCFWRWKLFGCHFVLSHLYPPYCYFYASEAKAKGWHGGKKINQRKDNKNWLPPNKQIAWCITVTFPLSQRGVSEKQQTIESDSQAPTVIINSCKSCWWAWESRQIVGRYREREICLNKTNQSNIHKAFYHAQMRIKLKQILKI